ncbi:MAG: HAMP domain-containing protein, partial [Geobacter sp.]
MFQLLRTLSLRTKLILVYVVIVGAGGIITSFMGSVIVDKTIMSRAKSEVRHNMTTARMVYENQLSEIRQAVSLGASGNDVRRGLSGGDSAESLARLEQIHHDIGLDFLSVTDTKGKVVFRVTQPDQVGDDVSALPVIRIALSGETVAATEILSEKSLSREDPKLADQARVRLVETPRAKPTNRTEETSGMVLMAASPLLGTGGRIMGVLYGGVLLNHNYGIVDRVWELVYRGERYDGRNVGTVTIFQGDLRISTNVHVDGGARALGTRLSESVYDAVLVNGKNWSDRAFVVNDWYLSEYDPIFNSSGETIGILYVGLLERAFLAIRNRVILTFIGMAALCFGLIILINYYITGTITRPIREMVGVTRLSAAGDLGHKVRVRSLDELGKLGISFNTMGRSLRQQQAQLEEWGKILEQKVKERTEELQAMQTKVLQTEKLASLGKMAAGIDHEINNPLGGILALSSLQLEDMPEVDPDRENVEEVVHQAIRCRDIVKVLLEFSRQTEAKMVWININSILDATLTFIEKQSIFHNVQVVKKYHPDLPLVMVDESQFQQVFMNIILNAIEAMKEVGALTLETNYDKSTDMVVVRITDSGSGIPPEILDKIFDPFFTTKEVGKGTGLGLSIVYGISTRHNGKISVASKTGGGTTFTIQIP